MARKKSTSKKKSNKTTYYYRKRRWGNYLAASQQRDVGNFVVKGSNVFTASYNAQIGTKGANYYINDIGTMYINFWDVLAQNKNFQAMKSMYDQVAINSVRVYLTVTDAALSLASASSVKSINIVTAWDRTGLSIPQITPLNVRGVDDEIYNATAPVTDPNAKWTDFVTSIGPKIANYSSKKKTTLNGFQNWRQYLYIDASTKNEKGAYVSCDSVVPTPINYNPTNKIFNYLISSDSNDAKQVSINEIMNDSSPSNPFENPVLQWKPTLLVSVYKSGFANGSLQKYSNCDNVVFNMEYSIDCTFRSMKGEM